MTPDFAPQPGLFRALVEQTPDAVVFADRDGIIRVWNPAAEAVFGFGAAEAIGQSLDLIVPERFRRAHWEGFHRAMASGRTRPGDPVRVTRSLHKLDRKLYVEISFGLIKDESGTAIGSVAVGRDCSARFLAEKARRMESGPSGATAT